MKNETGDARGISARTVYDAAFFDDQMDGSLASARVVPLIQAKLSPRSVVDVGCGVGTWLSVFRAGGVEDVVGVDGAYVERSLLAIPTEKFIECDVASGVRLGRSFDLAICLEVAEHLPGASAETLTRDLCALAPMVAFSAAVPGQGGTHHINEQWPTYWRDLFAGQRFVLVDCFRDQFWDNVKIACCYRQNLFLFVREDLLSLNPTIARERERIKQFSLCAVHPGVLHHSLSRPPALRPLLRALPGAVSAAIRRRLPIGR